MSETLPVGLQRRIRDQIKTIWAVHWSAPTIPVLWRADDGTAAPDPSDAPLYLDLEVDYGAERVRAMGGGRRNLERTKHGSVIMRAMSSAGSGDDGALDLLAAAEDVFRGRREGSLSFIGDLSGFDAADSADGNWSMRASLAVWEFRFRG